MRKSRGMIKSLIRLHTSDYCQDGRRIVIHVALHPIMAVPSCHAQAKHRVSRIRQYLCFNIIGHFTWFMYSSCVCQFQSIYPPINGAEHVERGPEGCETSVRERTCPPVRPSVCVCVSVCGCVEIRRLPLPCRRRMTQAHSSSPAPPSPALAYV